MNAKNTHIQYNPVIKANEVREIVQDFIDHFQLKNISNQRIPNISETFLFKTGEMYIYLISNSLKEGNTFSPKKDLLDPLKELFLSKNPYEITMVLIQMLKSNNKLNDVIDIIKKLIKKTVKLLDFQYLSIDGDTLLEEKNHQNSKIKSRGMFFKICALHFIKTLCVCLGKKWLSRIANHPPHILTKDLELSPSAFIPFCEFGYNMSLMGINIEEFDIPVCNCFKEKVLYDQLCYEVDLEKFRDSTNLEDQLRIGFTLILDYNTDRDLSQGFIKKSSISSLSSKSITAKIMGSSTESDYNNAKIVFDTIGKYQTICKSKVLEQDFVMLALNKNFRTSYNLWRWTV